jgi:TatD family-associated radical SAM protein
MNGQHKMAQTVAYEVGESLYINVTNKCSNRCDFCIRNNGDGAYGSEPLWLEREPGAEEILAAIAEKGADRYPEIVFCGYGEPTYRLDTIREVALRLKANHPSVRIRVNTNGQSSLIHGFDTAPLYEGAFDSVSISLNAPSAEKYQAICHSIYGERSFSEILKFAKDVKKYVKNVQFSVVNQFLSDEDIEESRRLADECGIALRVRDYIS